MLATKIGSAKTLLVAAGMVVAGMGSVADQTPGKANPVGIALFGWPWLCLRLRAAEIPFRHVVIDPKAGGDCKAVGDLDGDGFIDVVVASQELTWYAYPKWSKTVIAKARQEFTTEMQVGDVDRDGDPDIVVPDGEKGTVSWFENPRPSGDPARSPWKRHEIGDHGISAHDLEVGDLDGDGKLDVVAHNGHTSLWLQSAPNSWAKVTVATGGRGGLTLADLDGDRDLDLVLAGYWMEAPADKALGNWTRHAIANGWPDDVGVVVADLNGDGRRDVVLAPAESAGRLAWYEAADPRGGPWTEHVIDHDVSHIHTFKAADLDRDGQVDLAIAEMAQSPRRRVGVYCNGGEARTWRLQVVATTGSHNLRVADIGRDGDIDIIGANWQGPPVELWENLMNDRPSSEPRVEHPTSNRPAVFASRFGVHFSGASAVAGGRWQDYQSVCDPALVRRQEQRVRKIVTELKNAANVELHRSTYHVATTHSACVSRRRSRGIGISPTRLRRGFMAEGRRSHIDHCDGRAAAARPPVRQAVCRRHRQIPRSRDCDALR
jgi:hypothetical protein